MLPVLPVLEVGMLRRVVPFLLGSLGELEEQEHYAPHEPRENREDYAPHGHGCYIPGMVQ